MRQLTMLFACATLTACGGDVESRSIEPRYLEPEAVLAMVRQPGNDLGNDVDLLLTSGSRVITVEGAPAEVGRVVDLIRRYDRPAPVVRFRFQLVEADGFTGTDPAIADVEAALRDLFRFRGYRLAAESVAQGEAPGFLSQQITTLDDAPVFLNANLARVVADTDPATVSLNLELTVGGRAVLGTTLTLPAGKTAVVGSAQARTGGSTLILVVRPEIL